MSLFSISVVLATFLYSLVAGLLFAFAVVTMPGIGRLDDGAFLRAFQAMDRVIQNNQPLFMLVWVGSVVTLITAAILGFSQLEGVERWLLIGAALAYIVGVQLPTAAVNVPLNNRLQTLTLDMMDAAALRSARAGFELRWNQSNVFRTIVSCLVAASLTVLLFLI